MLKAVLPALAGVLCALVASTAAAQAVPGQAAPAFSAPDLNGKTVSLADFRGRYVVLEWNNPNCPFVQKHYDSGNMPTLQKRFAADKVAWVLINSTAKSSSDFMDAGALALWADQKKAAPTAFVLDLDGAIGRAYGARVTPHMYVINPAGQVIYAGAIDDKRSANVADVKTATNYVAQALSEAMGGRPVSTPSTTAYGCSIKY